MRLTAG